MCGIFGWLGPEIDIPLARRLRDRLEHRGPDDAGEWFDPEAGVWLGHRRLAILDLSPRGHQPMVSSCGRYVLTFNGEVYNYKTLRAQLESEMHLFHGESDTEVVLNACAAWGVENAVKRFEGMFAFALYDQVSRVLWLARDPMGIKPLYYAHKGEHFAFSSELIPLMHLPWSDRSVDRDALFSYFRYGCVPAPASILRGIRKLTSGTLMRFEGGAVATCPYWDLPQRAMASRRESSQQLSLAEAADELETRLRHAVRQHMQSDVPYGALLSGGIDSSAVVALMQAESTRPVQTFTIGFSEVSHDESVFARAIANHLGTAHNELILNSGSIPALVPEIMAYFDEPFADNSAIPTYLVCKFARTSVKVCLSGDGGDELFGGYPRYFWAKRIERIRKWLRPAGASLAAKIMQSVPKVFWDDVVDPMLSYRYTSSEGLAYRVNRFASYLATDRRHAYAKSMSIWQDPTGLLDISSEKMLGADAANYAALPWDEEMMLIDQVNYLQDDILTKIDRASMAVSLEARVPLLTHPMVEFSWKLPASTKLARQGDRGKLVLRELLYRYIPRSLIERPKQGFGMPLGQWLRGPLKEWAQSLLEPKDLEVCGLSSAVVMEAWREHQNGQDGQARLWSVLMYRQWYQRVFGN